MMPYPSAAKGGLLGSRKGLDRLMPSSLKVHVRLEDQKLNTSLEFLCF